MKKKHHDTRQIKLVKLTKQQQYWFFPIIFAKWKMGSMDPNALNPFSSTHIA